jgi:hypothetical protein
MEIREIQHCQGARRDTSEATAASLEFFVASTRARMITPDLLTSPPAEEPGM